MNTYTLETWKLNLSHPSEIELELESLSPVIYSDFEAAMAALRPLAQTAQATARASGKYSWVELLEEGNRISLLADGFEQSIFCVTGHLRMTLADDSSDTWPAASAPAVEFSTNERSWCSSSFKPT